MYKHQRIPEVKKALSGFGLHKIVMVRYKGKRRGRRVRRGGFGAVFMLKNDFMMILTKIFSDKMENNKSQIRGRDSS
ncbi:hypothetical protein IKF81_01395 [Candidatus Saccharibacteria bacterium]|nr:hypothetical protein [Candidatus Saccharibacteria bacterium]